MSTGIRLEPIPKLSSSTCGLSVRRACNRPCRKAHVQILRAADQGKNPSCDGELQRELVGIAEPELEPAAQGEDERPAYRRHVANASSEADLSCSRERSRGGPALVSGKRGSDLDVDAPREPDPRE